MNPTEPYTIIFWCTNEQGQREQRVETVMGFANNNHALVEALLKSKYKRKPYSQSIDVISVKYR